MPRREQHDAHSVESFLADSCSYHLPFPYQGPVGGKLSDSEVGIAGGCAPPAAEGSSEEEYRPILPYSSAIDPIRVRRPVLGGTRPVVKELWWGCFVVTMFHIQGGRRCFC